MPIIKTSPSEFAIHGGGPPAFEFKLPAFSANVGDGQRFAQLAERMFADDSQGKLVTRFEDVLGEWLEVRNVIGFSSRHAATRALASASRGNRHIVPAFGMSHIGLGDSLHVLDCETSSYGLNPAVLSQHLKEDDAAVYALHVLGRPCLIDQLHDVCEEWGVPLYLFGHQAFGVFHENERLGAFGRAEIFEFSRDQLVHAMDSAIITTEDDLLAHRLRMLRLEHVDGIDQCMSDAAAAMGITNLESADNFIVENNARYEKYRELLSQVTGIKLVPHDEGSTYQSIAIEVDPGLAGLSRNSLRDVLAAENVGTAKPFDGHAPATAPAAYRLANSLLQLPNGPALTDEAIEATCKLIELAIVRSLESPDPIRLAA